MTFFWLIGLLLFLVGTVMGSFINLLVYRSKLGKDWLYSRSKCEHCHRQLTWYENIPVFSYFFLRGKCSSCKVPIDVSHPLMELLTGALFLSWWLATQLIFTLTGPLMYLQVTFWLVVALLAMVIFISDWRYQIIPRWTVVALTIVTLFYRVLLIANGQFLLANLWWSIIWSLVLALFFFLLHKLTKGKGFGFGDVQLAIPLGLILGAWQRVVMATFLAFLIGAVVGVGLIIFKKKKFGQTIAFGPFLLIASLLSLLWGYKIWDWYVSLITGTAL